MKNILKNDRMLPAKVMIISFIGACILNIGVYIFNIKTPTIDTKYCYVQYDSSTILGGTMVTSIDDAQKLHQYYHHKLINKNTKLRFHHIDSHIGTIYTSNPDKKVEVLEYLQDSTVVKIWTYVPRIGYMTFYVSSLSLHDTIYNNYFLAPLDKPQK